MGSASQHDQLLIVLSYTYGLSKAVYNNLLLHNYYTVIIFLCDRLSFERPSLSIDRGRG